MTSTLGRHARLLSSRAGGVVDEMISHARRTLKERPDEALDILKAGLGFKSTGPDAGRLYLVQAEVEADRSRWPEVADLGRRAAAAASDSEPSSREEALLIGEVELTAYLTTARASLVAGADAGTLEAALQGMEVARKAFAAEGAEEARWSGLVLASGMAGLAQHAVGDLDAAADSMAAVEGLAGHHDPRGGPPRERDRLIAPALRQAAALRLATGDEVGAAALAARAAAGADAAAVAARAALEEGRTEVTSEPLAAGEAAADAALLQAQVSMAGRAWEAAEERLSAALAAAEGAGAERHLRVVPVLLLLGQVYSRTGRVTLAEGLYREACRQLGLDPGLHRSAHSVQVTEVHPSLAAFAAWRHGQLLTALPRRGAEADAWLSLGRALHEEAPLARAAAAVEAALSTPDVLSGKGDAGSGVVLDLTTRRALPCR